MGKKNYEDVLEKGKELISFYLKHPCIAAYDLLGVDLAPIQRLVFRDMWFKNYVIVVASRGFGKTYLLGTLAALNCMLRPGYRVGLIAPVFRQSLAVSSIKSSSYATFWSTSGMMTGVENMYNNVVPNITQVQSKDDKNTILSKWKNDERACIDINTTKGFELSGSIDHSVVVLDNDNNLVYKELQDITKDDYIAIKTGFNYFGNDNSMPKFDEFEDDWRTKDCEIPKELTPDLAYWMGLLLGDGCISISKDKRKQRVDFVSEDKDLLDSFETYLREYFLKDKSEDIKRDNRKNNTWEIEYYCKKLVEYLLKCGFTKTTALDKKIPSIIKKANREIFIAFIQGLMDTDGGIYIQKNKACEIHFNTSSIQLAKEVHSVLLNLGIVSNLSISNKKCVRQLPQGNKPSKCAEGYKLRITGQEFIKRFNEVVGFRCFRKKELFESYLKTHFNREDSIARVVGLPKKIVDRNQEIFSDYYSQGLYFVKIKEKDYFFAPTIDIEVENENCYWANGFINHNSKLIFSEVEKLYSQSYILQSACEKRPVKGSDAWYLKFKSVSGMTPSWIESLPLGDGTKIRGSRYYLVVVDELAQVPDKILDMVVRPMAATSFNPMERVRRQEQKDRLISMGLAVEDDFEEDVVNKMIMTSSGYYKFNHMWRRMRDHWRQMDIDAAAGRDSAYSVWQVPYWDLPKAFLDMNNINESRRTMPSAEFSMEYEAAMISDSEGFFKASLIDRCSEESGFTVELKGDPGGQYILGIDPNQGGRADCGAVVIRLGSINKVVAAYAIAGKTTQDVTKFVQDVCENFNIVRIYMDKGGGGKAVCDLLEEGYNSKEPIIDRTNDDHKNLQGRHILEMVVFNPSWIADANFSTKAMLEGKTLLFPQPPTESDLDTEAKLYETIEVLKVQMLSIVITSTASGLLHFDTPQKDQNKDIYSALILAAHGAKLFSKELEESTEPIIYGSGGFFRDHRPGSSFNFIGSSEGSAWSSGRSILSHPAALLKKKDK